VSQHDHAGLTYCPKASKTPSVSRFLQLYMPLSPRRACILMSAANAIKGYRKVTKVETLIGRSRCARGSRFPKPGVEAFIVHDGRDEAESPKFGAVFEI